MTEQQQILSISETVQRAKESGMCVSAYTLRRAIRSGAIPCRCIGRTYLIAWDNVVRWLRCEDGGDIIPTSVPESGGIRRLEV